MSKNSYEAEVATLWKYYEEVETDNELNISSDDDSVADPSYQEVLDHESDDVNLEEEESGGNSKKYYFGKDRTKWSKDPNPQNVCTRHFNIVSHLPGVIGNAKNLTEIQECWNLIFDDYIINMIVYNTNIYLHANNFRQI